MTHQVTITLRARRIGRALQGGEYIAAQGGVVYRVVRVTRVRRAGAAPNDYSLRLLCDRMMGAELPPDVQALPWPEDRRAPRRAWPENKGLLPTADPWPAGSSAARLARIRAKAPLFFEMALQAVRVARRSAALAEKARLARIGADEGGMHNGRDYGQGIRQRPIRARGGKVLRESDVDVLTVPDPDHPRVTMRRARRSDPLEVLYRAGSITGRELDAAEMLRAAIEGAQASMPCFGQSEVHLPAHQRLSMSARQLANCEAARRALAAIPDVDRPVVQWTVLGGTVSGFAAAFAIRHTTVSGRLRSGLRSLADYYRLGFAPPGEGADARTAA